MEKTPKRAAGKRILVTGSGTGIGRGIALEFAREGADVVVHYSHSEQGAVATVEAIKAMGVRTTAIAADFADLDQVASLAKQATEFLGGLDVLINNAGITMNRPFADVTPEQFDRLYEVNVRAPFFLTQALLSPLQEADAGAVVNITSIHAYQALPEHAVYAGTKGAIVAQTRELAIELAPQGVRVNAIAPGAVPVENTFKAVPGLDVEAFGKLIPSGFVGTPADVAKVAVFLASEESRFIVGQTLIVDGGTSAWMPFHDGFRQASTNTFGRGYVPGI